MGSSFTTASSTMVGGSAPATGFTGFGGGSSSPTGASPAPKAAGGSFSAGPSAGGFSMNSSTSVASFGSFGKGVSSTGSAFASSGNMRDAATAAGEPPADVDSSASTPLKVAQVAEVDANEDDFWDNASNPESGGVWTETIRAPKDSFEPPRQAAIVTIRYTKKARFGGAETSVGSKTYVLGGQPLPCRGLEKGVRQMVKGEMAKVHVLGKLAADKVDTLYVVHLENFEQPPSQGELMRLPLPQRQEILSALYAEVGACSAVLRVARLHCLIWAPQLCRSTPPKRRKASAKSLRSARTSLSPCFLKACKRSIKRSKSKF